MHTTAYNHVGPTAMTCFTHASQLSPLKGCALPNSRPCADGLRLTESPSGRRALSGNPISGGPRRTGAAGLRTAATGLRRTSAPRCGGIARY
jgi:hypothetical protein